MGRILNQAMPTTPFAKQLQVSLLGTAIALLMVVTAASSSINQPVLYSGEIRDEIEVLLPPSINALAPPHEIYAREIRIQRGDTVAGLLTSADINDMEALKFLRQNREASHVFRQLVPGKTIRLEVNATGELHSFQFPLNGGKDTVLAIARSGAELATEILPMRTEKYVALKSAVINYSLFGAADDAGIPDDVTSQLADIFGGDIDFHRDLRKGDSFSVIYETTSHLGRAIRSQHVLAAEFINAGRAYRAFWYQTKDRPGGYYTLEGNSVRKAFLRSPLEFSRISSGFSGARYHPVLKETRAHRGIDYAAAIGTRVKATGDGVVEFVGNQGGYGKVIMIHHPADKTTVYGHLSGFSPTLKKGGRVTQGEVIGYVGASGLASGPHLHYEFRIAGVHRNPLSVVLPPAEPLSKAEIPAFHSQSLQHLDQIAGIRHTQMVMLD